MKIDQSTLLIGLLEIVLVFYVRLGLPDIYGAYFSDISGAIILILGCVTIALAVENQ